MRREEGEGRKEKGGRRREKEKGGRRREEGEGRKEKGGRRREEGEGRKEKGEGEGRKENEEGVVKGGPQMTVDMPTSDPSTFADPRRTHPMTLCGWAFWPVTSRTLYTYCCR